ncbi:MAG: hypothetical protein PHW52_00755 [Candidatus Pacebacteria bacterium]|nr:hypothetical protein [Candidatus Paceibacterota bacterium]
MKKKIIIITLSLMIVAVGIFVIRDYIDYINQKDPFKEFKEDDFRKRFVSFSDFDASEKDGYVTYASKKAGISLQVHDDWELVEEDFGFVSLKSKDFIPLDNDWIKKPLASEGCWVEVNINIARDSDNYQNMNEEYIKNEQYINNDDDPNEQVIDLGSIKALESITEVKDLDGKISSVTIPNNNITYKFDAYFFGKDKERCENDFNIFLSSLEIKNINEKN